MKAKFVILGAMVVLIIIVIGLVWALPKLDQVFEPEPIGSWSGQYVDHAVSGLIYSETEWCPPTITVDGGMTLVLNPRSCFIVIFGK